MSLLERLNNDMKQAMKNKEKDKLSVIRMLKASIQNEALKQRQDLTDDEELYIPRGNYMGTKDAFMKEAREYLSYWNYQRPHSGICMNNRTPFEVLKQSGLVGAEKLLQFPVFILEDVIDALSRCTLPLEFESFATEHPAVMQKALTDQKIRRDIENRFSLPINAQNVLTYYRKHINFS